MAPGVRSDPVRQLAAIISSGEMPRVVASASIVSPSSTRYDTHQAGAAHSGAAVAFIKSAVAVIAIFSRSVRVAVASGAVGPGVVAGIMAIPPALLSSGVVVAPGGEPPAPTPSPAESAPVIAEVGKMIPAPSAASPVPFESGRTVVHAHHMSGMRASNRRPIRTGRISRCRCWRRAEAAAISA